MLKHHIEGLEDFLELLSSWFPAKPIVEKTNGSLDILIKSNTEIPIQFVYDGKSGFVPDLDTGIEMTLNAADPVNPYSVLVGFDTDTQNVFVRMSDPAADPVNPILYEGEIVIDRFSLYPDGSFVQIPIELIENLDHTHALANLSEKSYNSLTDKPKLVSDKNLSCLATVNNGDMASNTGITRAPKADSDIYIYVNGVMYEAGDGIDTKECYFTAPLETTPKTINSIEIGDVLRWNGSIACFQLENTDNITFIYLS